MTTDTAPDAPKNTITIGQLEELATELEAADSAQRERLFRLCAAYVRILAAREPQAFTRRACHYGDEAGHYDTSYAPDIDYSELTGPRSILLADSETEQVATSSGFYHAWRMVTVRGALAIGKDGTWYRSREQGTGFFGRFAARPGDCQVDVCIEWCRDLGVDEQVTTAELVEAEKTLRDLAFPLLSKRVAAAVQP